MIKMNGDLHQTPGYTHVNIVSGQRTVYFAGQMPVDETGATVTCADLDGQVDQTVSNALRALDLAEAAPRDVVRTIVYVASDDETELSRAWFRFRDSAIGEALTSASTLVGVAKLGVPGQLVELDMTAVLSD